MTARTAVVERSTSESTVRVAVNLDGTGASAIQVVPQIKTVITYKNRFMAHSRQWPSVWARCLGRTCRFLRFCGVGAGSRSATE